ncbi:hypothetical protein AB0O91_36315 [Kitasatospora sp. NPDC089797]|uniref:hypothetical protein n=1 Tax=Kitasatospora sp. NPDC089797 TaxID=3155298 RepID=UPI0034244C8F
MNSRQHTAGGIVAAAVAGSLVLGIAPAALADDATSTAEHAASVVERATGTEGLAPTVDGVAATDGRTGRVRVAVPETSGGAVEAIAADGTKVALGLPRTRDVTGVRAGAGTVVYPDAAPATDIAVQATTDGGARAVATLKNSEAPAEQRYTLDLPAGTEAVANDTGGYDLVRAVDGGMAVAVGQIDAPWAKDAKGSPVATSYRLEGSTLVQKVEATKDTAFPVVADPKVTWGYVTGTIYFNRGETRSIALGGGLGATAIAAIPGGLTTVVGVTMAAITARAAAAYDRGRCLKIKLPHVYPDHYAGGYCQ